MDYYIRQINNNDIQFLWDMLYEIRAARCLRERKESPSREILKTPELAKYVQNWGRTGDAGFVAISSDNQTRMGAAWYRLFREDNKGYGYVDSETPEKRDRSLSRT